MAVNLGFQHRQPSPEELERISREIITQVNYHYHLVYEDEGIKPEQPFVDHQSLERSIEDGYRQDRLLPGKTNLSGYGQAKPLLFPDEVARFGISGIYMPFTSEPSYINKLPGFDIPFTMAHEMAHARGFAREDEASFAAFLICTHSTDARLRYSGYLSALSVLGRLYQADPERYKAAVSQLEVGPRSDLKARAEFWARYTGKAFYLGQQINHLYLKANGIRAGVRSYNEINSLIIGYYLKANFEE
jgi:hypothetical protein